MTVPAGWRLASGRKLPNLLFVTCPEKLAAKIGADASEVCNEIVAAGARLLTLSVSQSASVAAATATVQSSITSEFAGVVILGGYEVVPAQRLDTLLPGANVSRANDMDLFVIWSDDAFGAINGRTQLPVSRIPDAGSAAFVWKNLAASANEPAMNANGMRNINRPFAAEVYSRLPNPALPMQTSIPCLFSDVPPYNLSAHAIYIMLHGSDTDASVFSGENGGGGFTDAMKITNVPSVLRGSDVFAGCCWGALIVTSKASAANPAALTSRTVGESLALTFLANGARAFAGCTGTHYSPPRDPPYVGFAAPLHRGFWSRYCSGSPPALALYQAKYLDYAPAIPHIPGDEAYERKVLFEFTCLGLGW